MERSKVRIAVIGIGTIGPRHIESITACSDAELVCIVDPSDAAQKVAAAYGVPLYRSVHQMLRTTQPEVSIVCTPNHTHVPISKELLTAGVHVLVEKPLSNTVESGKDLVKTAEACDKQLLVGHHRRFNPYTTAAQQVLSSGTIGTIIAVSGLWSTFKPCLLYTSPSPRDGLLSRMPSSA